MKLKLKIFGERNTGTNYLAKLIENNFEVEILRGAISKGSIFTFREWTKDLFFKFTRNRNLGWKHSIIDLNLVLNHKEKPIIITLTKNPYSFLLSLYNRPYHYKGNKSSPFLSFLKEKWKLTDRDNCKEKSLNTPIELWNIKNKSYINLLKDYTDCLLFTYEELLENPNKVISSISEKLNIPLKEKFKNYNDSTKNDNKDFNDYQNYYLNELWKRELNNDEIIFINSKLDLNVLSYFGYEIYKKNNENIIQKNKI
jgi:hypothetical protein